MCTFSQSSRGARRMVWLAITALAWAGSSGAQTATGAPPPPQNVVSLSATASVEVNKDWLSVVFSTTREGADGATVQAQLRNALETALAEARKAVKPGQLEVQTGAFSLYPRSTPKGGIAGWIGTTEMVVEGRDTQAISQLTARVQTLSIARVGFSLSREAREKVESEIAAQAIARFRARADAVSRQFGFGSYTVREVAVSSDNPGGMPMAMVRAQSMRSSAEESLPVEAGKATVSATVSGTVQMR